MPDEATLRSSLGIPEQASQVLVVAESTHWDPDWLLTSTEYLRLMVAPTLDRALDALAAEPRRIYSVECAFYPAAYLRLRPERTEAFVRFANEGRLRFTGSGVTTPDTLLPEDELLLRDLLEGASWLRSIGITAEPRTLYLPDSFGHSPGVPALLGAAGVEYASICRIDGMSFPGAELESDDHFPVPGTTAARLTDEGSADFFWRSPDGSKVLTHWHAFGYGHGDMIGHAGFTRVMGLPLAWPSRQSHAVGSRIEKWSAQLAPLARTPYRLLSIGFDFSRPVPRLVDLLDAWNGDGYERTGIWAVNAGLDDYFDLVACHAERLPTIDADPNPYWTGFYATRPALKRACRDLGRDLVTLDALRARRCMSTDPDHGTDPDTGAGDTAADSADECRDARWIIATANHHDLITGTSPDRTARREQWPWIDRARRELTAAVERLGGTPTERATTPISTADGPAPVERDADRVSVTTAHFTAIFDAAHGGTLVSLTGTDGDELVRGRTLACESTAESGGLWRMGLEFPGGTWHSTASTAESPASVAVTRAGDAVVVRIDATLEHRPVRIIASFPDAEPVVEVTTEVSPRLRRTVGFRWEARATIGEILMHQPGAVVSRPLARRYEPTFWPLHSWLTTGPAGPAAAPAVAPTSADVPTADLRFAIATAVPTAVRADSDGTIATVVARTAPRELAWGVVPLLGPAWGWERGIQVAHLAIAPAVPRGEPADRIGRMLQRRADLLAGRHTPEWPVVCDDPDIEIASVKPADRGAGVIVRLRNWHDAGARDTGTGSRTDAGPDAAPGSVELALAGGVSATITSAVRCDALERDGRRLTVTDGVVTVPIDAHLVSVRLTVA
ncbi:MAG: hypothetical protein JST73_06300 [Actinobacteria bacterium]|nr:hypothetical protein [Actinomycetota bacterium]